MKLLIKAMVVLMVLHFLLVAGFVGWFIGTGRLDDRRGEELKVMLTETVADRDAREDAEQRAAEAEQAALEAAENPAIPLTADEQINRKLLASEADRQHVQRMRREIADLQRTIQIQQAQLEEAREAFLSERDAFEAARERIKATEGNEQFQAALETITQMKADQAYSVLNETLMQDPSGYETVIAYLDNLEGRKRAEILGKFEEDDPILAAKLLELLRTRGLIASAAGTTP
jgi:pyruvate/2-oxoglutarate dehydrogenase complex dihydrolipoamide acyltransferase (E2) component